MARLDIFIRWDNDQKYLRLPILPESFSLEGYQNNTTVTEETVTAVEVTPESALADLPAEEEGHVEE